MSSSAYSGEIVPSNALSDLTLVEPAFPITPRNRIMASYMGDGAFRVFEYHQIIGGDSSIG